MEVIYSSETSVDTTRCYISEDDTLHNYRCENLKSYELIFDLKTICPEATLAKKLNTAYFSLIEFFLLGQEGINF
jgi:hypothetical protein